MDRIAALRNVETALAAFEDGQITLAAAERRTLTTLRTFAAELEPTDRHVYHTTVGDTERVLVADSPDAARERAAARTGHPPGAVSVERLTDLD